MSTHHVRAAAEVRARIDHPVVDADGHTLEFRPALDEYLVAEGALDATALMQTHMNAWDAMAPEVRASTRAIRPPFWGLPAEHTLDLATTTLPGLMYERLPELGIDVSVVYPSFGVGFAHVPHDDLRRAACRAVNRYHADVFREYASRLVPVAVIPMHTPEEAVAELHHAVRELGFRAVVLAGWVRRPIEVAVAANPALGPLAAWYDFFGLDSPHDYDPVWQACAELGVMPSFHSGAQGWHGYQSISNYSFNHIGHFAAGNHAVCKAIFLGGVSRRFPQLRFGFLEGGVSWAVTLLGDLVGHWEKRNPDAIRRYDPKRIDRAAYRELFDRYGGALRAALPDDLASTFGMTRDLPEAHIDEYDGIGSVEELLERFVPRFFFGCEADDPMTPVAFDGRRVPGGRALGAMFSSDLGHWDVPDMALVLGEAYEAVDDGALDAAAFRAFAYENAVRFYAHGNPNFFAGTSVATDAAAVLGSAS